MIKAVFDRLIGRVLRFAKRAYQALPLGYESKAAHRRVIARLFPWVLLRSGAPRASIPALGMVSDHLARRRDFSRAIWTLLVLSVWQDELFREAPASQTRVAGATL